MVNPLSSLVLPAPDVIAAATLLAIDDEPAVLAIVERFAREHGFNVIARTDARAALVDLHSRGGSRRFGFPSRGRRASRWSGRCGRRRPVMARPTR